MATNQSGASIESITEFESGNPAQQWSRWQIELSAAEKEVKRWHGQSDRILDRFLDERNTRAEGAAKLNLFTSNTQTLMAVLYGNEPDIDVRRRFLDADDDPARVAAEMLERMLNTDVGSRADGESVSDAVECALSDRLLVGMGMARVRYDATIESEEVPAQLDALGNELSPAYTDERKTAESVEVDYVHWRDVLWSPARTWCEVRWIAYRVRMTRDDITARFGDQAATTVAYGKSSLSRDDEDTSRRHDPWQRADVWEIWSRDDKRVFWWNAGSQRVLDEKPDPLGLKAFFPSPRPMMANLTTRAYLPKADYTLYQDQYNEIDALTARISMLQTAVKAAGVYDKSCDGIGRLMSETLENTLIPVDSWAAFSERGGLKGAIDWVPIVDIVAALDKLRDVRAETIQLLNQLTGMFDLMRGQQTDGTRQVTAAEQKIKANFGSVRVRKLQGEFSEWVAGLQRLKAEIIARHFDDGTIVRQSNVMATTDAQMAGPALQTIREKHAEHRITIESDQMAMTDYARDQNEKSQFLQGFVQFMQAAAPMIQSLPQSLPFLLQMLQWGVSGFRGAQQIEGVMDKAIDEAEKAAQQPQQQQDDGKQALEQFKAQAEMQKIQATSQAKQTEIQAKAQTDMAEIQAKAQADTARMQAETAARTTEIQLEAQLDDTREQSQARWNTEEARRRAEIDVEKARRMAAVDLGQEELKREFGDRATS